MPNQEPANNGIPPVKAKHVMPYLLIFVLTPAVMYYAGTWLDALFGFPQFPPLPWNLVSGSAVFFTGLYVGIKSTRTLYVEGRGLPWGEIGEQTRSSKLVTSGPYSYTRNPMTLGYSMLPIGMGLMFRSPSMELIFPVIVLAVEIPLLKLREEPNLEKRFGSQYLEYRMRTPFLLPDLKRLLQTRHPLVIGELTTNPGKTNPGSSILQIGYLGTSLTGLLLLVLLTYSSGAWKVTHPLQKEISLSVFLIVCFGGVLAALYPSQISRATHFKESRQRVSQDSISHIGSPVGFVGHHPQCGAFNSHVLYVSGKGYCAGCTGLAAGALASIAGSALYTFWRPHSLVAEAAFWAGVLSVALGLLQYRLGAVPSATHFVLNVSFVLGPFFLLIGVTELAANLVVQAYLMFITLFWILARISLSRLEHDRICGACTEDPCSYAFGREH